VDNPLSAEALLEADIDNCDSIVLGHPSDLAYPHGDAMVSPEIIWVICQFWTFPLMGADHYCVGPRVKNKLYKM
jgi:hypothetical protein